MFDKIPEITYEKFGAHYIGSATDSDGDVVFGHFLAEGYSGAFLAETSLTMKDGSVQKIKDYWWDNGCYAEHQVDLLEYRCRNTGDLQKCYVYRSLNIDKTAFQKMLDDYYSREKEYRVLRD